MIFARLDHPAPFAAYLENPAWQQALQWLRALPGDQPEGVYPIRDDLIYANLHSYETLPVDQCRWESHRRYLDIQLCLAGGELIDWVDRASLVDDGPYDAERDLLFHQSAPAAFSLPMRPGWMAILGPQDAHRPKRTDRANASTRKVVVKIAVALLAG